MTTATLDIEPPALPLGVTLAQAARWPDTVAVCHQLRVSGRTLSRMIRRGQLRCYLVFGRRRFNPVDLAAGVEVLQLRPAERVERKRPPRAVSGFHADRVFGPVRKG